jgi:tetratricopeptide (TPR) repeat protein
VTEQSEHLSSAQIENYGNRTSGAGPDAAQGDERQRVDHQSSDDQSMNDQHVEAHLADCPSCRNRVLDFHRTRFALVAARARAGATSANPAFADSKLADAKSADSKVEGAKPPDSALADSKFANPKYQVQTQVRTAPTPECPSDDDLRQLAADLSPDDAARALTRHAATCDHCGPLLQTFTEDFSDDFSPEEQAVLANLQSSSAAWQKNTAREMLEVGGVSAASAASAAEGDSSATSATVKPDEKPSAGRPALSASAHKPFFWKWVLVPAAAATVAVAAFSIWYTQRDTPEKVEKLLAQAYTEQRTTEMRWPGARWGEPKETLGAAPANKPLSLLKADDAIQRQTPETLRKKEWLHLRAQNEILGGGELLQLIKDLTEATQSQPDSTLMFDSAIANFRMGEVTHERKYYEKSKDVLDEMLASSRNSSALFDRAVVEQRLNLKDAAIIDLSECLEKETDRKWMDEIQQKIQRLKASSGR